jgi:thiol-disulfide isomerase/thioredoxin
MKKNYISLLFLTSLSFISTLCFCQTGTNFSSIPEVVYNGDTIQVLYDAGNTILKGQKSVSATMYAYQDYQWNAYDVMFKADGNHWIAPVIIPKDCGLLAFKFKADTLVDNNHDKGYFLMMRDKKRPGLQAKGAYAGWGLARSPRYGMDIPDYMKFEGISDSATYHWLSQEISQHQESKSLLVYPYAVATSATFKADAPPRLKRVLAFLMRTDASENDLLTARKIQLRLLNDKAGADSVDQVIKERFPKGSLQRLAAFRAIPTGSELKAALEGYRKFIRDYPEDESVKSFDADNRINYEVIRQNIIVLSSYLEKNYSELDKYLNQLSFGMVNYLYYKIVDIPLKKDEVNSKTLLSVSDRLVKRLEYLHRNKPVEYSYLSPQEWNLKITSNTAKQILIDHIILLNKAARYQEALGFAESAYAVLGYKNAAFNNEFAIILSMLKSQERLKMLLVKSVYENQASPEMLNMLKASYIKEKGSDAGFQIYLEKLSNKNEAKKMRADITKTIIKNPMVDFSMQDLSGKTVKTGDLKGKTVVFDFWATWCVPCKASFPGMKLAVEKYQADPDVVFYFVDTQERGDSYKKEVADYIKANKLPFNVLFDNKAANEKATGEVFDRLCKMLTISGIPQKIVVDRNGMIRFKSVGFKGSATELADEISTMVEITKELKQ